MGKKKCPTNQTNLMDITTGSSKSLSIQSPQTSNCAVTKLVSINDKPTLGDVCNVYIMRIDSLHSFYVQQVNHYNYFQKICSEFDNNSVTTKEQLPKAGDLVATRDENNLWHRARVIARKETGLTVCFIDLGISDILITEYKNLPKEFTGKKTIFHRCILKNLSSEDVEILNDPAFFYLLSKYLGENEMTITFLNKIEPYFVTLSHNGQNVLDILSELIWDGIVPGLIHDSIHLAKCKMLTEMISDHQTVVINIKPIISIKHFYVETESCYEINKNIRTKIENKANWISVLHPDQGQIVIAKNSFDSTLYRARVILHYENCEVYKCFLIDCGKFIDCTEFFEPCDYLRTTPPSKIHCSLNALNKINDSLLESLTLSFIDELADYSNNLKTMNVIKIGSPCIVDFKMKGLKISKVIRPCEVTVIDIININSIKVRLNTTEMKKIVDVLKCVKKVFIVSNPKILNIYMVKLGEHYKRIKYLGLNKSGFEVMLIDVTPVKLITTELYELPKSIQNIQTLDIYCSLGLNIQEYSKKKFIDICDNGNTKFLMVVIKNDDINGHIVKLFLKFKDVKTMICN